MMSYVSRVRMFLPWQKVSSKYLTVSSCSLALTALFKLLKDWLQTGADHGTVHELITWLSCTDHVTAHALMTWLFGH